MGDDGEYCKEIDVYICEALVVGIHPTRRYVYSKTFTMINDNVFTIDAQARVMSSSTESKEYERIPFILLLQAWSSYETYSRNTNKNTNASEC